jgi:peptidoglycan/xylan/chitin deacetylase (PgdA/CDA1 family)
MKAIKHLVRKTLYKAVTTLNPRETGAFIMCYHSVGDDNWEHGVTFGTFKKQIDYLTYRYKAITFKDVLDIISGKSINPEYPSFALTFDDGYKDIMSVKDYLKEKGIKPVLFLLSDSEKSVKDELKNSKQMLDANDIKLLIKEGWEIGSHSATHKDFWHLSDEEINTEVVESKKTLEEKYGVAVNYFSYPRGRYTKKVISAVKEAGYKMAVSMDDGKITAGIDQFTLPRVGVMRNHDFSEFKTIMKSSAIQTRAYLKNFAGGVLKNYF